MGLSEYRKFGSSAEKVKAMISSGRVPHSFIIEGDNNIDKEGFAKAFAKALMCVQMPGEGCGRCITCRKIENDNYEDMFFVRPEDRTSKKSGTLSVKDDQISGLQSRLMGKPTGGDRNIAVISHGDTMTQRAQSRLLKTLEEPTPGTVIMILVENGEMLLPTIDSRCVKLRLNDIDGRSETPMTKLAAEIVEMIAGGALFFDSRERLDKSIKGRADAYAFLDGMESALSMCMRSGGAFSRDDAARAVGVVENARTAVRMNVVPKYAVRDMVLKLRELQRL